MNMAVVTPRALDPAAMLLGLSAQKKAVFFRHLASMVNAGLPVSRAVSTASQAGLAALGKEMASQIDQGASLSETMTRYPYHFDTFEVALVRAGETAGQLDRQLQELANNAEAAWQMSRLLTSKLLYPIIIVHAAIFLPPLFLLVQKGVAAYISTVATIIIPLYLLAGSAAFLYRFFRIHGGPRRFMDHVLSNIPILAGPLRLGAKIRFLSAMANLTQAGLLPNQSIPIAAESSGNFWVKDSVMEAWERQGRESAISAVLQSSKAFSPVEIGLVFSGEEAGSLEDCLRRAAENLKPDYQAQVHRLTTVLPIILLLLVGLMVGYIAVRSMTELLAPLQMI